MGLSAGNFIQLLSFTKDRKMDRYPKLTYQEKTRSFRVTSGKKLYGWVWGYEDEWHCEDVNGMTWAADTLYGALCCLIDQ